MASNAARIEKLLEANVEFSKTWKNPFTMKQMRAASKEAILVVTCMDPRIVPEQFLGSHPMVAVSRNAGGRYGPDVMRTIQVLRSLMFNTDIATIMVVHHTDCGVTHVTDESVRMDVEARDEHGHTGWDHSDYGCFPPEELAKSVIEDVRKFRAEEVLKGVEVRGYTLSTETGLLEEVFDTPDFTKNGPQSTNGISTHL